MSRPLPTWTELRVLGESKLLASAYVWVLVVPITLRLRDDLPVVVLLPGIGEVHPHDFSLPFRIYLFYFSAVFAAIATAIYALCCPAIVKVFHSASDFVSEGRGERQLIAFFRALIVANRFSLSSLDLPQNLRQFREDYCTATTPQSPADAALSNALGFLDDVRLKPDVLKESFWYIRDMADRTGSFARGVCLGSLVLSIALIILVFIQNLLYVIQRI